MGPFFRRLAFVTIAVIGSGCAVAVAHAVDAEHAAPPAPTCERDSAHGWHGVAASRDDARHVAVWSNGSLWVSRDDGRRWTRPLHLARGYVAGAIALRGGRFAVLTGEPSTLVLVEPTGRTVLRRMPFDAERIAGSSSTIALVARADLAVSHDAGRRWQRHTENADDEHGSFAGEPFVDLDGTVRVLDVEINTCRSYDRLEWVRAHVLHRDAARVERRDYALESMRGAMSYSGGAHGWLYAWNGSEILGVTRHRARPLTGFAARLEDAVDGYRRELVVGSNGWITVGVLGRDLVRLDGDRAVHLSADAPPDASQVELDARGRPWVLTASGTLWRFSRLAGWSEVLPGCALPITR